MEVLVLRRHRDRVVRDHVEPSAGVCTQLDLLDHRGPVAEDIHLLSGQYEAHRALQCARRQYCQDHLELRPQSRTEGAADKGRHDPHVVRVHLEHAAYVALHVLHALDFVVDSQLDVALEDHRRRIQLHRVVMLNRHIILATVACRGGGERLLGGTARLWWGERVLGRVCGGLQREGRITLAIQIRDVRFFLVSHADQRRPPCWAQQEHGRSNPATARAANQSKQV